MKKFLITILQFAAIGLIIGEIIVRLFHLNIDVPKMYKHESGLIGFYPNQAGYSRWSHKWVVTKYGNFGYEPKSLDNIFTVIGDSYIANTINPPECHQANYLSAQLPGLDFFPSARGGASFIEFLEMKKSLDSLSPKGHLIYIHHGDLVESIRDLKPNPNTVQVDLKNDRVIFPKLTASKLKDFLYRFKFFYFWYRNYLVRSVDGLTNNRDEENKREVNYVMMDKFLSYVGRNYDIKNLHLIVSPDSDIELTRMLIENGFKCFQLKADNYRSWQLENDSHWSCFGHSEAAKQVKDYLINLR